MDYNKEMIQGGTGRMTGVFVFNSTTGLKTSDKTGE